MNLWTVFAETTARFGAKTAVEVQRSGSVERFTYRQLFDMASAWAAWLAAEGIVPGDRCAILAHNDAHWCAAYLGILKRGAIAVPLDTNYSAAQVATIVRDSGAKLLFVSDKLKANAASRSASKFACVRTTPLGSDVVPLVYRMTAALEGSGSIGSNGSRRSKGVVLLGSWCRFAKGTPASSAFALSLSLTNSNFAPESRTIVATCAAE